MTAAQIHSAVESGENDFKIDGREVGMVRREVFFYLLVFKYWFLLGVFDW